jgi:hypothetical protein
MIMTQPNDAMGVRVEFCVFPSGCLRGGRIWEVSDIDVSSLLKMSFFMLGGLPLR